MKHRYQKRRKASAFSKIAPIMATGFGFVAFAMVVPSNTSTKNEARIFTQGLSIQIDRSSPAYAALEDTLSGDTQALDPIELIHSMPLMSGSAASQEPVALRIVREAHREEALVAQERNERIANSQALVAALSRALPTTSATQAVAAGTSGAASNEVALAQAEGATVISGGTVIAPPKTVNKTISRKEFKEFLAGLAKALPPKPTFPSVSHSSGRAPALTAAGRFVDQGKAQQQQADPENQNTDVHQLVISGPVEFTGGIAITNSNDSISIYREVDEETIEHAQVSLRDGKYEVFVDQPIGRLVGELKTASGQILGRGYYNLATLPRLTGKEYRVDKIAMTIGPVPHGVIGAVTTAAIASDANPKARTLPVKNAHVQLGQLPFDTVSKKDGTFKDDNLTEGSIVITHADRPGHWGALGFSVAGWPTELPMFTDATVRAIMVAATGSDHENERNTSIVWGRVTRGGQPVAGARVDLMTSEGTAVYFNKQLLPDPTLKTTGENGLYAFFPLEPGSHAVQATDGHGVTEPSVFPTDQQTTTQVNLELNVSRSSKIRVYDAFKTDWPLSAEVTTMGRKRGAIVPKTGELKVTYTGGNGVMILDTDAGTSYERVRTLVTKSATKIDVPMVQTVWISRIMGALRVNQDPHTGSIVGFIRGASAYQVSLEDESLGPNTKIVYFDAHGEITGLNYGVEGGGFLMLNVPEGFRTVLIQPAGQSAKALAAAVLIEGSVTNVISKKF